MARPHRPTRGNVYEKRPVTNSSPPQPPPSEALTSTEARQLGAGIDSMQERYRTTVVRLLTGRACGLVVVDSRTGAERLLTSVHEWHQLQTE
jgi:hypothetical protein